MSSLDEVYDRLIVFARALRDFDESVGDCFAELENESVELKELWSDQSARKHWGAYEDMSQNMRGYLHGKAPELERFVDKKVRILDAYLSD